MPKLKVNTRPQQQLLALTVTLSCQETHGVEEANLVGLQKLEFAGWLL